jgi:hypothetical protein
MLRALVFFAALAGCESSSTPTLPAGPNAIEMAVKSNPPGATVIIDGVPLGTAPTTVKMNPGPHRARASMSGYYPPPETKFQVGDGQPHEVTINLVASH